MSFLSFDLVAVSEDPEFTDIIENITVSSQFFLHLLLIDIQWIFFLSPFYFPMNIKKIEWKQNTAAGASGKKR